MFFKKKNKKTDKDYSFKWMNSRFPITKEITLNLRRIFVFPSKTALAFLVTIFTLFLIAINFQNSLVYGLSFWLLALLVIAIFFTYRNLSMLTVKAIKANNCFAGEKATFELALSCPEGQKKSAIEIGWKDQDYNLVDLVETNHSRIKLSHNTFERGYFQPKPLSIFTRFPLGLIKGWSYAHLDMRSIVYPKPELKEINAENLASDNEAEKGNEIANGTTDFSGISDYQAGDSPKKIHWGAYAKTGKVYSKTFVDYASHDLWLDLNSLSAIQGTEAKLSHLCALVLQYHQEQQNFGLKLLNKTIQPNSGDAHKNNCLTALALYGKENNMDESV